MINAAHYTAHSAHNTEKHPAHYPEQSTKPSSLKAIAGAVLRRSTVMCECATPRNAQSHITNEKRTLPCTLPAHCNIEAPDLARWIIRMAKFYQYSASELKHALDAAAQNPDEWREIVRISVERWRWTLDGDEVHPWIGGEA